MYEQANIVQLLNVWQTLQHIFVDTWIDLFTRGLDENAETYKAESLPPQGSYIFRAVIGNILGNNYYNHSAEIDIPKGEHCDLCTIMYVIRL